MKSAPLLSIVTVTYEDPEGLRRTLTSLASIVAEAAAELEVLVVDGGSGLEFCRIADEFQWADVRSEPDNGIYDAMNKGLLRSKGSFVWFLNGGDECALSSWKAIRDLLESEGETILLAQYLLQIGSRKILRSPRSASYIWHGLPTSHQAIFYPGRVAREIGYDDRFAIVGDYHFTACLLKMGLAVRRVLVPVATFHMDGISFEQAYRVAIEASIVQKEILKSPLPLRWVSRVRHGLSRNARRLQAKAW